MNSNLNKKYILDNQETNFSGKYLQFVTKKYVLETDETKKMGWECVLRTNTQKHRKINGAEIIPIIRDKENDRFNVLLIDNFRFPVEKHVFEFPSGIIDECELSELDEHWEKLDSINDQEEKESLLKKCEEIFREKAIGAACRELKEETGYVGEFKSFFALPKSNHMKLFENIFYDPWKGTENAAMCIFEIDKNREENKIPVQDLEECEIIKTHEVPLDNLLEFITDKIENENYACSSHVYSFAMGLKFQNFLKNIFSDITMN
jgi:8-oxo-dGTP pyrophosphatase MutT (NUDIX family)